MRVHIAVTLAVVSAAAIVVSSSAHAAVLIDDFSQTTATWPVTLPPNLNSGVGPVESVPNVLFGSRSSSLAAVNRPNPSLLQPSIAIYTPPGLDHNVFELDTPADYPALLTINYQSGLSFASVDLSATPVIDVHVDSYDLPAGQPLVARLFIRDTDLGGFKTGADVAFSATSGDLLIPLSTVPALDATHIEHLVVQFQPAPGGDLRLSSINAVVPEPSAVAVTALGAAGLLARRRRHIGQ